VNAKAAMRAVIRTDEREPLAPEDVITTTSRRATRTSGWCVRIGIHPRATTNANAELRKVAGRELDRLALGRLTRRLM
jgi:hypothetical protein